MKRRQFLHNTSLAAAFLPATVCQSAALHMLDEDFPLMETTLDELQRKMKKGVWTAEYITRQYLARIDAIDRHGPSLHSVIELNPDALDTARALDAERKTGKIRGPLHGVPVLLKDNIDTADKMMTTAGSLAMEGHKAKKDAFLVAQLRAAGAVILGKTNLSEWANFRSTNSTSGWSSRGGQTKNPYRLSYNPCGSSSGSGVAVSANLCAVAVGTETNGSIACPSSINGIVGIKPTVGLVSRSGIIPISKTQDTAGPMARTVRDAAILLGAMVGVDEADPATQQSRGKSHKDYTQFLDAKALKGKRIGVETAFLEGNPGVSALLKAALETLKKQGATVVEVGLEARIGDIQEDEFALLCYEFKDGLNQYLANTNAPVKNLSEVIAFNKKNASKAMPWFKQEILEMSEAMGNLLSDEYLVALGKVVGASRSAITGLFAEHKLDAIIGPTNGPAWCTDHVKGDTFTGYGAYSAAAMAGFPSISVPMGVTEKLPIGLTFTGLAFGEPALLALAYAFEQATKLRAVPAMNT
jgi:amidase